MILDAIIALFGSLFAAVSGGIAAVFVPLINAIAAGVEALVGVFVSGFSLGRVERDKCKQKGATSALGTVLTLAIVLGLIGWFLVVPKVLNRNVTLVAKDGHSLPFAALIVHTSDGTRHERTDNAGNIVIPRFGTDALTVKDPRYLETTWKKSELESKLTVSRTILGSGLDSLADRLRKPAKE